MKQVLNTLYLMTQDTWLSRDGECVLVRVERKVRLRVPIHTLGAIVCFGRINCTTGVITMCAEKAVDLVFLSPYGRFRARIQGPISGNVLLRRQQYRWADDPQCSLRIAQSVILGKISNCRTVLQRALRDHAYGEAEITAITHVIQRLGRIGGRELMTADNLNAARGLEGEAAMLYFSVFDHLILAHKEDFFFDTRNRRPPLDRINALLSFLYSILTSDVAGAVETVGLDPAVGYLHRDRPGRPSLALDLVEELRSVLADRLVLSLVNRNQLSSRGFSQSENGAVLMDDDTRKTVLSTYQKRKQEEIVHPYLNEKIPIGLIPQIQARLLARHIRGDLDAYPPFIWK